MIFAQYAIRASVVFFSALSVNAQTNPGELGHFDCIHHGYYSPGMHSLRVRVELTLLYIICIVTTDGIIS